MTTCRPASVLILIYDLNSCLRKIIFPQLNLYLNVFYIYYIQYYKIYIQNLIYPVLFTASHVIIKMTFIQHWASVVYQLQKLKRKRCTYVRFIFFLYNSRTLFPRGYAEQPYSNYISSLRKTIHLFVKI